MQGLQYYCTGIDFQLDIERIPDNLTRQHFGMRNNICCQLSNGAIKQLCIGVAFCAVGENVNEIGLEPLISGYMQPELRT